MLMIGLAIWISGRKIAGLLVLLLCMAGSLRPLLKLIPRIDLVILPRDRLRRLAVPVGLGAAAPRVGVLRGARDAAAVGVGAAGKPCFARGVCPGRGRRRHQLKLGRRRDFRRCRDLDRRRPARERGAAATDATRWTLRHRRDLRCRARRPHPLRPTGRHGDTRRRIAGGVADLRSHGRSLPRRCCGNSSICPLSGSSCR